MARPPAKTTARKAPARPRKRAAKKAAAPKADAPKATAKSEAPIPQLAAETPARPEPEPAKARRRVTVTTLEQSSTKVRVVLLNLAFVGAFLLIVPVIISQFWLSDVMIEPISVPDSLAAIGLTSDVVASRLWDGLQDAEANANTSKQTVTAIPTSKRIKFSIPETGVSIESLVNQTRQFFQAFQTRIGGEFICASASCAPEEMQLRLRVIRDRATVIDLPPIGTTSERDYFETAAVQVLSVLDPFVAISATAEREPLKAVTLARQLIRQKHPDARWAYNLIGNIRDEAKEYSLAAAEYRAALALDPGFTIAKKNLASTLIEMGSVNEAGALYGELDTATPRDPDVMLGLAEIAAREGHPDDAVALLVKAAPLAPNDPRFLARAGQLEANAGKPDAAKPYLEQALAIDPSFPLALGTLGAIYFAAGDFESAEPLFGDMAEFLPDDIEAQDTHAATLMLVGKVDLARERLERGVALDPNNVDRLAQLASAYFRLDRLDDARATLEKALALDPGRGDIHASLGQLDLFSSNFPAALAHYEDAAALDPANPQHVAAIADTLYFMGRVPDAIAKLEGLLQSAPDRVETWFTLGSYYSMVGRIDESVAAYENFLTLVPDLPMFAELRALAEDNLAKERPLLPESATEVSAP